MDTRVLTVFFVFILVQNTCCAKELTNITIFYETHCPDSQKLMINQVVPTLERFGSDVHFELVPYGFAKSNIVNGTLSFKCQHGSVECEGNMIHSCAQKHYGTRREDVIRFAGCTMQYGAQMLDFISQCAKRYQLDYSNLKYCASSDEGLKLLQEMDNRTSVGARIYSPKRGRFTFIPSTFIDGRPYIEEATADLPGTICRIAISKLKKC